MKWIYIGNQLARHGVNPTAADLWPPLWRQQGHQVVVASSYRAWPLRLMHMWVILWLERHRAQGVVMDVYSTRNFYYAWTVGLACRWLRIPYICVLHGGQLPRRFVQSPGLCRQLFEHAAAVVAPSSYLQQAFVQAFSMSCFQIPNPLFGADQPLPIHNFDHPRILWVRALDPLYQPDWAIQVMHQLQTQYPKAQLTMVGPDRCGLQPTLAALAQQLGVNVTFTGALPQEAWHSLASSHNVFLNTSSADNQPLSVLEAMALGLPVVTTAVGGIPNWLTHAEQAMVVPPDPPSLAAAIVALFEDEALRKRLLLAAGLCVQKHRVQVLMPQWLQLFERDFSPTSG